MRPLGHNQKVRKQSPPVYVLAWLCFSDLLLSLRAPGVWVPVWPLFKKLGFLILRIHARPCAFTNDQQPFQLHSSRPVIASVMFGFVRHAQTWSTGATTRAMRSLSPHPVPKPHPEPGSSPHQGNQGNQSVLQATPGQWWSSSAVSAWYTGYGFINNGTSASGISHSPAPAAAPTAAEIIASTMSTAPSSLSPSSMNQLQPSVQNPAPNSARLGHSARICSSSYCDHPSSASAPSAPAPWRLGRHDHHSRPYGPPSSESN